MPISKIYISVLVLVQVFSAVSFAKPDPLKDIEKEAVIQRQIAERELVNDRAKAAREHIDRGVRLGNSDYIQKGIEDLAKWEWIRDYSLERDQQMENRFMERLRQALGTTPRNFKYAAELAREYRGYAKIKDSRLGGTSSSNMMNAIIDRIETLDSIVAGLGMSDMPEKLKAASCSGLF